MNKPGHQEAVRELVSKYMDIFTNKEKKVGMVPDRYRTTIKLKPGTVPIKQKLRPLHPQQQTKLKVQLNMWMKEGLGVILPLKLLWASPEEGWLDPMVCGLPLSECLNHRRLLPLAYHGGYPVCCQGGRPDIPYAQHLTGLPEVPPQ